MMVIVMVTTMKRKRKILLTRLHGKIVKVKKIFVLDTLKYFFKSILFRWPFHSNRS